MKKKVLGLIEELNPNNELLTDDPDIATKLHDVINQVMFEVIRMRKLPDYVEIPVEEGKLIRFSDIEKAGKYEVYQVKNVRGVEVEFKADNTVIKALESGIMEIDYFKYPERIDEKTKNSYEFELPNDVLEIMPYGVASDLLKSDVSSNYGEIYAKRYNDMIERLDPRYSMGSVVISGGINV